VRASPFASVRHPERNLVFGLNDVDETLPGPWGWDVKRLAASFVVAARLAKAEHHTNLDALPRPRKVVGVGSVGTRC